jgi:transcription termination factor Rho
MHTLVVPQISSANRGSPASKACWGGKPGRPVFVGLDIEVLVKGYGFLCTPDNNCMPGPVIYVYPFEIREFKLESGGTIGGNVGRPQGRKTLFPD